MITFSLKKDKNKILFSWDTECSSKKYLSTLLRLFQDSCEDFRQETPLSASFSWWSIVPIRFHIHNIIETYNLKENSDFIVTEEVISIFKKTEEEENKYNHGLETEINQDEISQKLNSIYFRGGANKISHEQMRNILHLCRFNAAATFSVPGAGKTTEALAFFFIKKLQNSKLIVVAPKNAFATWDEQLEKCQPNINTKFSRLVGGREKILENLDKNPEFSIISYQQLVRVPDIINKYLAANDCFLFLDESHRIKSGISKVTARSVLSIAHTPSHKLIMSGTPMPQSVNDLIPQFKFLYPGINADETNVVSRISPIYVRTTKNELKLPPVTKKIVPLPLAPMQQIVYNLLRAETFRTAQLAFRSRSRNDFRRLGKSVMRMIQAVSNPALLGDELAKINPKLAEGVLLEGDGPKINYVCKKAKEYVLKGKKVLIWTGFVKNVEHIAFKLSDCGAVYIHGGVNTGNEDDDDTREGKIKMFHDSSTVNVLVANPAAASESISLHTVCHNALYLDRSFNAAHYLQSEDRIHRLGLPERQETLVEIVEGINTIDEVVRNRLEFKIQAMANVLNDRSLQVDPTFMDSTDILDFDELSLGLSEDDINEIFISLNQP